MKILFILDCSLKNGFGNLSRCYLLYKELKKNNDCYFWIENNTHTVIRKIFPDLPIINKKISLNFFLTHSFFDRIIFDNNNIKIKNIKKNKNQKIIALDYYLKNNIIDVRINLYRKKFSNFGKAKVFTGLKYAIMHHENIKKKTNINNNFFLLISLGGGATLKTYRLIINFLKKINFNGTVHIIRGIYEKKKLIDNELKIKYIKFKKNFIKEILKANLIITNAGNTLLLSCLLGVPSITFPKNKNEFSFAKFIEKKGATLLIDSFSENNLLKFNNLINAKQCRSEQIKNKKIIIDNMGVFRVAKIIIR
jgi:spore coat polysaccharide biosynthesis predicted glycosyltransferase SpsG